MTATSWFDFGAPMAREHAPRRLELIGLNARLSGTVDLGWFGRLTDHQWLVTLTTKRAG